MKITILLRHVVIDDKTKAIIEKKITKLDKFFDAEQEALVTLRKAGDTEILELTINAAGMIFRSEVKSESYLHAIDTAVDVIERQIRRNKTKLAKKIRSTAFDKTAVPDIAPEEDEEDKLEQIRVKEFNLKPMTVEEAILQMNLLAHNFFVFQDQETEKIFVAYKRADGGYGVIKTNK
ncbi:MAG: ribosome-associated translation inhibitor RaiA [Clostridia bacterium]|nr:ribosome-associated translation inhibitor RaiA [Clostridia bacterium]